MCFSEKKENDKQIELLQIIGYKNTTKKETDVKLLKKTNDP